MASKNELLQSGKATAAQIASIEVANILRDPESRKRLLSIRIAVAKILLTLLAMYWQGQQPVWRQRLTRH